ncbi:MAG: hypothetical protein MR009_08175 [Sutterellaceae bacterium]|nr:hypothetical protein [Sutterellaceae bacterium]MDD7441820.1 hypothetical protein [Sutterellaceae bacterium]MDY2868336.1 hypothetical protein [Mesosutterella sp.]
MEVRDSFGPGVPYADLLVLFDPEEGGSVREAGEWASAAKQLGCLVQCADAAALSDAVLSGSRLRAAGFETDALVLSGIRGYSASVLDLLLNFVLFGGSLAASGPVLSGSSAITEAGDRSAISIRSEIARVENYTSRAEPWDEINSELLQKGIASLRTRRPDFTEGGIRVTSASVAREDGRDTWTLSVTASEATAGSLRIPEPAREITLIPEDADPVVIGSATGPVIQVTALKGTAARIRIESASAPKRLAATCASGWFVKGGKAAPSPLVRDEDWMKSAAEGPLLYSSAPSSADLPPVPEGGSLLLDLGNSAGTLAVSFNGRLIPPSLGGDGTMFPIPKALVEPENEILVAVKGNPEESESEDGTVGLFSIPDWVKIEAVPLAGFSIG